MVKLFPLRYFLILAFKKITFSLINFPCCGIFSLFNGYLKVRDCSFDVATSDKTFIMLNIALDSSFFLPGLFVG